jgi:hypothetical protein
MQRNFICPVTEEPCENDGCRRDVCREQHHAQRRHAVEAAERAQKAWDSEMLHAIFGPKPPG